MRNLAFQLLLLCFAVQTTKGSFTVSLAAVANALKTGQTASYEFQVRAASGTIAYIPPFLFNSNVEYLQGQQLKSSSLLS